MQHSFADVVLNGERMRQRHEGNFMQRDDSETWSIPDETPVESETDSLKQQLSDMARQNSEQQQTIQQLMQQLQSLTSQIQVLTAQNFAGGAQTASTNPHGTDPNSVS